MLMTQRQASQRLTAWLPILLCALSSATQAEDLEPNWSYRGEITSPGTRSEGFSGYLFYGRMPVPGKLAHLVTPIGTYAFRAPEPMLWAVKGWINTTHSALPDPAAPPEVTVPAESPHWYRDANRSAMPGNWVYLPAFRYWVEPSYLTKFADTVLKNIANPETTDWGASLSAPDSAGSATAEPKAGVTVFTYRQETAARGSKSAGERGILLLNGLPVPGRPGEHLLTRIGTFYYIEPGQLSWEPSGWFPGDDAKVDDTVLPLQPADLKKGHYTGPRRTGTPADWCYSPETNTWYSPERLLGDY